MRGKDPSREAEDFVRSFLDNERELFSEESSSLSLYSELFWQIRFGGGTGERQKESCTKTGNSVLTRFSWVLTLFLRVLTSKNGVLRAV